MSILKCEVSHLYDYNLLIGAPRNRERAAASETRYFISDLIGDEQLYLIQTPISGLLACRTSLDPFEVVHTLIGFATENPYQFRYAIKFVPLERAVPSEMHEIVEAVRSIKEKIQDTFTFRVTVRRRHTPLEHMDIVKEVAAIIERPVNLDMPDWHVWVEVVGEWTGVSVLKPNEDILAIMTMRDDQY